MDRYYTTKVRPICPSCGEKLADKENVFKNLISSGINKGEAMDMLDIKNVCCRVRFLTPAVIPKGNYYQKFHESELNVKFDFKVPSKGLLVALQNIGGEEHIVSVVLPSSETVFKNKRPEFVSGTDGENITTKDLKYSEKTKHIEEKTTLFRMSDSISFR